LNSIIILTASKSIVPTQNLSRHIRWQSAQLALILSVAKSSEPSRLSWKAEHSFTLWKRPTSWINPQLSEVQNLVLSYKTSKPLYYLICQFKLEKI